MNLILLELILNNQLIHLQISKNNQHNNHLMVSLITSLTGTNLLNPILSNNA